MTPRARLAQRPGAFTDGASRRIRAAAACSAVPPGESSSARAHRPTTSASFDSRADERRSPRLRGGAARIEAAQPAPSDETDTSDATEATEAARATVEARVARRAVT